MVALDCDSIDEGHALPLPDFLFESPRIGRLEVSTDKLQHRPCPSHDYSRNTISSEGCVTNFIEIYNNWSCDTVNTLKVDGAGA